MPLALMLGKFVMQDVREWYLSTTSTSIAHHDRFYLHPAGRCYTSDTTL